MAYANKMASLKAAAEDKDNPDVSKVTSFAVDPRRLQVEEGFNARPLNMDHVAKLSLAYAKGRSLKPLDVRIEDGHIFVVDGHHRHAAALDAIAKGAPVRPLRCDQVRGEKADFIEGMIDSADVLQLTLLQLAIQVRNLIGLGRTEKQVAERFSYSGEHVKNLILLANAPEDVQQAVSDGQISGTAAVAVIKEHGCMAGEVIREGIEQAKARGKSKVTPKILAAQRTARSPKLKLTIDLIPVGTKLPDADTTVFIVVAEGELWMGYLDGDTWRDTLGTPLGNGRVVYWATVPEVPAAPIAPTTEEKTPA